MRRRNLLIILLLQAYAFVLAGLQYAQGLRTDEAKYLLNIPYPHPPFARSILSATEWIPMNEWWWRCIFATLLVQAVWLFIRCVPTDRKRARIAVFMIYLISSALVMQAGTIMMAPLSALFGAFFVSELLRPLPLRFDASMKALGYALVWLASLFTAYQGILFAPIVYASLVRLEISRVGLLTYFFAPLFLLALYTLSNPLAVASIVNLQADGSASSVLNMIDDTALLWLLSGSIITSVIGALGIFKTRSWPIALTLGVVLLYSVLSYHDYYAILFMPLSMGGAVLLLNDGSNGDRFFVSDQSAFRLSILAFVLALALSVALFVRGFHADHSARDTLAFLSAHVSIYPSPHAQRAVCIAGDFGHEWQYASRVPIVRYAEESMSHCDALICFTHTDCPRPPHMMSIGSAGRSMVFVPQP